MDDGDAIPAAPEDLIQMNQAQASGGQKIGGFGRVSLVFAACSAGDDCVKKARSPIFALFCSPFLHGLDSAVFES